MKRSVLLIATLFLLLISCHKSSVVLDNPYGLPNATQTGAGIFACRINGVNFIAPYGPEAVGGFIINDSLTVHGKFITGRFFYFLVFGVFKSLHENTTYNLSDSINNYCEFGTDSTCQQVLQVTTIYPHSGSITITKIDTTGHTGSTNIISGAFNCKVPISNCDTLEVTDGRFDLSF